MFTYLKIGIIVQNVKALSFLNIIVFKQLVLYLTAVIEAVYNTAASETKYAAEERKRNVRAVLYSFVTRDLLVNKWKQSIQRC